MNFNAESLKQAGENLKDRFNNEVVPETKQTVDNLKQKTSETVAGLKDKVSEAKTAAAEKSAGVADKVKTATGNLAAKGADLLDELADKLRSKTPEVN